MKFFPVIFFMILLGNAALFSQDDLSSFFYLEGKWIIEKPDKSIHEEWTKVNDTLLTCVSFYVKNGDTTNTEKVSLQKIGNDIFYIPVVEHNTGPVKFKLTSYTNNKAVFENLEHDFPQRIIYELVNDNTLNARIEGPDNNGGVKGIDYPFKRVKK